MAKYSTPLWQDGASPAIDAASLLAIGQAIEETQCPYAVCSTAAGTAAKTATISLSGTLSLFNGLTVRIKFTYGNTAGSPTLNVNGTGAKAIRSYGTTALSAWTAGKILTLTYDGSGWLVSGTGDESNDAKVATGSYTGTGTYGSGNPNSLTLNFSPKLIVLQEYVSSPNQASNQTYTAIMMYRGSNSDFGGLAFNYGNVYPLKGTRNGNTATWYTGTGATQQMNKSGASYDYVAIG